MDKEPLSYAQTELFAETGSEKQGEVELRNPCRSHEANRDGRQAGRQIQVRAQTPLGESASPGYRMPGNGERHNGKQSTENLPCGNAQKLRAGRRKAGTVMWKHASPAVYWLCGSSQGGAHSCDINMHMYSFFLSSGPHPRDRFWNLEKVSM